MKIKLKEVIHTGAILIIAMIIAGIILFKERA
jgi:hypothetical protein